MITVKLLNKIDNGYSRQAKELRNDCSLVDPLSASSEGRGRGMR